MKIRLTMTDLLENKVVFSNLYFNKQQAYKTRRDYKQQWGSRFGFEIKEEEWEK